MRPRRIALPGLAMLAASAAQAAPAGQAGEATVDILEQVELVNTADLNFGAFAAGPVAGTIVVSAASGARSTTGGVTAMGGTVSRATFTGRASRLSLVVIRSPDTPITLTRIGGTETMRIEALTLNGSQFRLVGSGQTLNFAIGGTLSVNANQAEGAYQGSFDITVDYY